MLAVVPAHRKLSVFRGLWRRGVASPSPDTQRPRDGWMIFLRLNPNLIDGEMREPVIEVQTSARTFFLNSVILN